MQTKKSNRRFKNKKKLEFLIKSKREKKKPHRHKNTHYH